jgi:hypothetical protein
MIATGSRSIRLVSALFVIFLVACQPQAQGNPRPAGCPSRGDIDATCARAIVREYALRVYPGQKWTKFDARYDEENKKWLAYAEHAPNTPGNYFFLHLSTHGQVLAVQPGQ